MSKYAAFLRGINSGKNSRVKMEVLREAFEKMGFENVRTVIASGNVIFETSTSKITELERRIEKTLPDAIGFKSDVIVLPMESLKKLVMENPFKGIMLTTQTKPYVTFIKEGPESAKKFPARGKDFTILGIFVGADCSVVDRSTGSTTDLMRELDKIWKVNTTRGWKTLEKILR